LAASPCEENVNHQSQIGNPCRFASSPTAASQNETQGLAPPKPAREFNSAILPFAFLFLHSCGNRRTEATIVYISCFNPATAIFLFSCKPVIGHYVKI